MGESGRKSKRYKQLLRMPIGENRFLVISITPDNKISMAQQIKVIDEHGRISYFIIKNAFLFHTNEVFNEFRKGLQNLDEKVLINSKQLKIKT